MRDKEIPKYVEEAIKEFEKMVAEDDYKLLEDLMKFSKGELFILKILLKSDTTISPTQLSEKLNSSKARISAILNSLEKKGEITREIDKENRRNIKVTITERGKEHITNELKQGYNFFSKALTKMGKEDTEQFISLIKKFLEINNQSAD